MQQYLDQTEKHLATSDKLVEDQKALIAMLEERGRDTTQSTAGAYDIVDAKLSRAAMRAPEVSAKHRREPSPPVPSCGGIGPPR